VGLSLEYSTLEAYAGTRAGAVNPVLVRLIAGLAPRQRPVLRIGGDSTDWAWWPVNHMRRPGGIRIAIGARFGAVLRALAKAVDARLILGIDLEANSRRIAAAESTGLLRSVGRGQIEALELGNEPELYATWPWRILPSGRRVIGRASDYGMAAYVRDFRAIGSVLPRIPLAGPALGGPLWISRLGEFLTGEPRVGLVTLHTYPLQACYTPLVRPTYPTIGHLLARRAAEGLAEQLGSATALAHAHGLPLRVDELNNVACGGKRGVSNTFASALWALDAMFSLLRAGVDGVNIHTPQRAAYALFKMRRRHGRWDAAVAPEYYGLLMFARAAPPGSRLLPAAGATGRLRTWATVARDGAVRIVLINEGSRARDVVVRAAQAPPLAGYQLLRAPGLRATGSVSLGGRSFAGLTSTGILGAPQREAIRSRGGAYTLALPAASAVMLTLPAYGSRAG
jgi:hypothetical protein